MTQAVQGSNLLDVLKKKMRQTKEEMEKYKEEGEDMGRKLQLEIMRREEVSVRIDTLTTATVHCGRSWDVKLLLELKLWSGLSCAVSSVKCPLSRFTSVLSMSI